MTITQPTPLVEASELPAWHRIFLADAAATALEFCPGLAAAADHLRGRSARVVVLYSPPAEALSGHLLTDAPQAALAAWQRSCEALLAVHRGHRGRVILIEAPLGAEPGEGAVAALAKATNGAAWPETGAPSNPAKDLEPLAALLLAQQPEIRALIGRLQAASHGPYKELPPGPVLYDETLAAWRGLTAEAQERQRQAEVMQHQLSRQVTGLEAELRQTVAEAAQMPRQAGKVASLETRLAEAETARNAQAKAAAAQIKTLEAQKAGIAAARDMRAREAAEAAERAQTLEAALAEAVASGEALAKAAAKETKRAETLEADLAALRQAAADALAEAVASGEALAKTAAKETKRAETLEADLAALRQAVADAQAEAGGGARAKPGKTAKSGASAKAKTKAPDPVRQVRGLAAQVKKVRQRVKEAEAEIVDLGHQLEQAQAACRETGAQRGRSERAVGVLTRQAADLQAALLQAEQNRALVKQEKLRLDAAYRRRVAELSGMLDAIYKSTSWRITRPARSVMRRVRR